MKKPRHPVSDHAVLRYLERVHGVDIEGLRRRIGRGVDRGLKQGASGVVLDGFTFKIRRGVVTTVVLANRPDMRTGKVRGDRPGQ